MVHPGDVVIGLEVGVSAVRAAGFDRAGRQLGLGVSRLSCRRSADGAVEQDPAEVWQRTVKAVHGLARVVPDLARRTVVVGITGRMGGTWLIDEDGDPLPPALLWLDRSARSVLSEWRRSGAAAAVGRMTGSPLGSSSRTVQIAWLHRHRPEPLERAARALSSAGWLHFCLSGRSDSEPVDARIAFGRTQQRSDVLRRLGLEEHEQLLAAPSDPSEPVGHLVPAAGAATGLLPETPVVLGPPAPVAAAFAAGAHDMPDHVGISILGGVAHHVRRGGPDGGDSGAGVLIRLEPDRSPLRLSAGGPSSIWTDWLTGLAQGLLADAGLIGLASADLASLLEQRAAEAAPGRLLFREPPEPGDRGETGFGAALSGLDGGVTLYDVLRAILESTGYAIRAAYDGRAEPLQELRITGRVGKSALQRRIIAACIDAPVRRLMRPAPAAAGAAMAALRAEGHEPAADGWILGQLSEPELPDPALVDRYAPMFERWRRGHPPPD